MFKWLKKFLFGIWALLLIPLAAVLIKLLDARVFSDPHDMVASAIRDVTATPAFNHLVALGQHHWFRLAMVFLTGMVVGTSLEWLGRKAGEKKAARLRSLGWKFRSLSDSLRLRTASAEWPDSARDLRSAMLSLFASARSFDVWAPTERVFQLPDASFLCEYFRCVGGHLEGGDFDEARREALSWRPFLDQGQPAQPPRPARP